MTFEEWAKSILKFGTDPEYGIAKAAWDAATNEEREACANICDAYSADKWALYKGRAPYGGMEEGRAEDYVQGQSAGSESCGDKIRERSNVELTGSAQLNTLPKE